MQRIIKRNGQEVEFDKTKIVNAIKKANAEVDGIHQMNEAQIQAIADKIAAEVEKSTHAVAVEDIQDMVETGIMEMRGYEVAQKYIRYRYKRSLSRKANTTDEAILSLIDMSNEEIKQENSNKNPTIVSVQRDYMAGEVSKDLTKRILLPEDVVQAHEEGIIHFHDMDYYAQKEHNCFSGTTKFVTNLGIKKFSDFQDGNVVQVVDKDGRWRTATVHLYGKKKMQIVTLQAGRSIVEICCTPNHRWILKDGTVTTNLKVGDSLYALHPQQTCQDLDLSNLENARLWALGFAIGDGVDVKNNAGQPSHTRIRLCGHKNEYVSIFKAAEFSINRPEYFHDDYEVNTRPAFKQDFLNGKAWRFLNKEQARYVFAGYFAADGSENGHRISTSDERIANMIREISALAGFYIASETIELRDTNYKNNATLFTFRFRIKQNGNNNWVVKKISSYRGNAEFNAWCVEEPVTHSFTLANGIVTGNCDLINLDDMLQNGTCISGTHIDKPKSFATACTVTSQIVAQVASCQFGGQTFTLSHLAPFVDVSRKKIAARLTKELAELGIPVSDEKMHELVEDELRKEVESGCQTIQYQLITLQSTNGQAPFVTVFMYLHEIPEGQTRDDLALIIEIMLKQRMLGVKDRTGHYITPAFPKLIYVLQEDNIKKGSKYYYLTELAAQCTAKRMVPDYISEKIMKELKGGDTYPCMGCRSFLTPDRFTEAGLGNMANAGNYDPNVHKYYGRFNQGVVTINLVDVACSSEKDMDKFWEILNERLELCHKALRCRHERLLGTLSDVAPILWQDGALARLQPGETIDKLLYNGYSTISLGYAGLSETVFYMLGVSHTSEEGRKFGLKVMQALNDACSKWKSQENIDYSVYGTPLESTTYKFAKCLQKRFGIIKDVTDHNYITNSYHINVREKIDAFSKLTKESEFQKLSPGGAVSYIEVPNMQNNIPAILAILTHMYNTILYAEINTKSDYCDVCGYDGEIQIVTDPSGKLIWRCPNCGNRDQTKMSVARRTCGYIGTQFWNQGRTAEIKDRVVHVSTKIG